METDKSKKKKLPPLVEPGLFDVLLGRGKSNNKHQGNQIYEDLVDLYREPYKAASCRLEKVHITQTILTTTRNNGGWFLRHDHKRKGWFAIDEQTARKKIAQAIQYCDRTIRREAAAGEYATQTEATTTTSSSNAFDNENRTSFVFDGSREMPIPPSHNNNEDSLQGQLSLLSDSELLATLGIPNQQQQVLQGLNNNNDNNNCNNNTDDDDDVGKNSRG